MSKLLEAEDLKVDQTKDLAILLGRATQDLRQAVEVTLAIRRQSQSDKEATIRLWENFLGGLFGYIKQRSKESKDNLLSGISLTRMRFF